MCFFLVCFLLLFLFRLFVALVVFLFRLCSRSAVVFLSAVFVPLVGFSFGCLSLSNACLCWVRLFARSAVFCSAACGVVVLCCSLLCVQVGCVISRSVACFLSSVYSVSCAFRIGRVVVALACSFSGVCFLGLCVCVCLLGVLSFFRLCFPRLVCFVRLCVRLLCFFFRVFFMQLLLCCFVLSVVFDRRWL